MKPYLFISLFIAFALNAVQAVAQNSYTLSGKVLDEKGEPMKLATVFISGTKKITGTNEAGEFAFQNVEPGTYQLSVQSVGYAPFTKNVLIQTRAVNVDVNMKVRAIMLNEVKIGKGDRFAEYFEIFKTAFLGESDNAKECVILNPRVINFGTQKYFLTADADEFMIIENKRLGYRIRYLLKAFDYNTTTKRTKYDGETSFEELEGTDEQKAVWAKNRKSAYTGSLMHFLRSVYHNNIQQEGFVANQLYMDDSGSSLVTDSKPLVIDEAVTVIDTSFISLKFTAWMIRYDPKKAAKLDTSLSLKPITAKRIELASDATVLNLHLNEAVIDKRGSFNDYRTFLIQGYWGRKRIGDQVPFEYQPPALSAN